jgi:hypothetical protein
MRYRSSEREATYDLSAIGACVLKRMCSTCLPPFSLVHASKRMRNFMPLILTSAMGECRYDHVATSSCVIAWSPKLPSRPQSTVLRVSSRFAKRTFVVSVKSNSSTTRFRVAPTQVLPAEPASHVANQVKNANLVRLVSAYRQHGHKVADLNPLKLTPVT